MRSTGVQIEIWSDVVCPWCFVGKRRLEKALTAFPHRDEVEVVYRSFELDPTAPQHGHEKSLQVIAAKYGRSEEQMRQMMQQLIDTAADDDLDLRLFDTVHTRTVDAHRLLHLALAEGGPARQRTLKEALLSAYFLRAEDVGDHGVLRAAAVAAGLDGARVDAVLATEEFADAVAADVAQARAYGATGVPFFVVDQKYGVSGAQPTDVFAQVLAQAWAARTPLAMVTPSGDTGDGTGTAGSCDGDTCAV